MGKNSPLAWLLEGEVGSWNEWKCSAGDDPWPNLEGMNLAEAAISEVEIPSRAPCSGHDQPASGQVEMISPIEHAP